MLSHRRRVLGTRVLFFPPGIASQAVVLYVASWPPRESPDFCFGWYAYLSLPAASASLRCAPFCRPWANKSLVLQIITSPRPDWPQLRNAFVIGSRLFFFFSLFAARMCSRPFFAWVIRWRSLSASRSSLTPSSPCLHKAKGHKAALRLIPQPLESPME